MCNKSRTFPFYNQTSVDQRASFLMTFDGNAKSDSFWIKTIFLRKKDEYVWRQNKSFSVFIFVKISRSFKTPLLCSHYKQVSCNKWNSVDFSSRSKWFWHRSKQARPFSVFRWSNRRTCQINKHPSVHFFPHGPRLFHLSTEKTRVQSVRNGHQKAYSRADTINNNKNKDLRSFQ